MKTTNRIGLRRLAARLIWTGLLAWSSALQAGDDWELWASAAGKVAIDGRFTGQLYVEDKLRDDMSFSYERYADAGVTARLDGHWTAGLTMRFAQTRSAPGVDWREAYVPFPSLAWSDKVGGWSLEWLNRVEFKFRPGQSDCVVWRLRGQIAPPTPKECRWKPYANDEVFFDDRTHRIAQNRAFVGVRHAIDKTWSAETYAGVKSTWRAGDWTHANVLGVRASCSF